VKDGIRGAYALKPDGAGVRLSSNELSQIQLPRLWWRPKSLKDLMLDIAVQSKDDWGELIQQAATYTRALNNAKPLRQFSLVIAYNHVLREMRFLVFHAGGLTASRGLYLEKRKDHSDIL
jgi:hypothetical protein